MRLAIWSPLPPSSSGIADYVAEALPLLSRQADVTVVVEDPAAVDPALAAGVRLCAAQSPPSVDLDLYHIGNSPPHAYVFRHALLHPGVAFVHDWNLHQLMLWETVERSNADAYLRMMRRAHGEKGAFVGRQIARALGGQMLPALFPLGAHLLDGSLAAVALTQRTTALAAQLLEGRPTLRLAHHLSLPLDPLPSREEARRSLGLPADAPLVVAPGLATPQKQLDQAVKAIAGLRQRWSALRLVVAGAVEPGLPLASWAEAAGLGDGLICTGRLSLPDFVRALVAADVVLALRFPSQGEMSGALVRALGVGRPVLVTSGTTACEEIPANAVVPIDPGAHSQDALEAHLQRLLEAPDLAREIGDRARAHVAAHHGLPETVGQLVRFLEDVAARRDELAQEIERRRVPEDSLLRYLLNEIAFSARELGLPEYRFEVEDLLRPLTAAGRTPGA